MSLLGFAGTIEFMDGTAAMDFTLALRRGHSHR
jgi:hypothetical protein